MPRDQVPSPRDPDAARTVDSSICSENLADAGAKSFMGAFQAVEHLDPAGQAAPLGTQVGPDGRGGVGQVTEPFALGSEVGMRLAGFQQSALQRFVRLGQFLEFHVDAGEVLRCLGPL